jgi:SAM-dependent methyltransferase
MTQPGPGDADFWEQIYAGGTPPWDKQQAAPPLVRALNDLDLSPGTRAFVPGCGIGHEALHLARRGARVTAVDIAAAAVDGVRRLATQASVEVRAVQADLFDLPAEAAGPYDLLVEHTCFCAIPPARRDDYAAVAARLLPPGGRLIGLFFEVDQAMEEGPPFPTTRADVEQHFGAAFRLDHVEQPADSFPGREGREWLVSMTRMAED